MEMLNGDLVKVKITFCIAYCYETIIFQYAIITDKAGVQPCPALICRLMVTTLLIHGITLINTHLLTPKGWKAELAELVDPQRMP